LIRLAQAAVARELGAAVAALVARGAEGLTARAGVVEEAFVPARPRAAGGEHHERQGNGEEGGREAKEEPEPHKARY
jgi:hypothetical protein